MLPLFDTHAHYTDSRFDEDRDTLLATLPDEGIKRIIVPGTSFGDSLAGIRLAEEYDYIWAAAGIHPHEADGAGPEELSGIEKLLENAAASKICAVGEAGLDYHYDFSPRERQREVFSAQLALAARYDLPVIIHDREAHADCLDIVQAHNGVTGVLHCYSGSAEFVRIYVDMGFYISFTGSVTFKNAHRLRDAAKAVPSDRLLIETDAPYMAPVPHRGKRCDSRMMTATLAVLADIYEKNTDELAEITTANAFTLFRGIDIDDKK